MASEHDEKTDTITPLLDDNFHIKGAASQTKSSQRTAGEPDTCSICLESITERAVAVPCNHLTFDFLCLVQWLQEHACCPLCKVEVKDVQYDWRGPENFKTYRVLGPGVKAPLAGESRRQTQPGSRRRNGRRSDVACTPPAQENAGLTRRRQVYDDRAYSLHIGSNSASGYHDFTPSEFTSSPELQSRARAFLRRELQVFGFLDRPRTGDSRRQRGSHRDHLLEYIVAVLKTHDPKAAEGHAEDLVAEFLGRENANLLLHELDAWLRSPYATLDVWDERVQYAGQILQDRTCKATRASSSGR